MDGSTGGMVEMLRAMSGILVTWAAVLAVFTGIGLGFRRLWGLRPVTADAVLESFWTGLVAVVLMLSLWHLVWPVHWPVQAVLAVVGVAGLLASRGPLWDWLRSVVRHHRVALAAAVGVAVVLSNRALGPCTTHDSGLYHLNAVRWVERFPIVPGLGNLHTPLAYNNTSFLLAALLEIGPWYGRSSHLANTLYLLVFLMQGLLSLSRLARAKPRGTIASVFALFMMVPVALMLNRSWATSHSVEVPVAIVLLVAAERALAFLTDPRPVDRQRDFAVLSIVLLLALAVSIKISSLPMAALMGIAIVVTYVKRCRRAARGLGAVGWILALPMLTLGVWVIRGVILSGYLLYPFPVGSLAVDWAMPANLVHQARDAISDEAVEALAEKGLLDWVGHLGREVLMPTVILVPSVLVIVRWRRGLGRDVRPAWLLVASAVPAIAIWAATAPQKRFVFYIFWILAGVVATLALRAAGFLAGRRMRTVVACALVVLALANVEPDQVFLGPGSDGGLHAGRRADMGTYVTASGLVLLVPKTGTQCWDSPLPSTPKPRPDLRLRRPGYLASGFTIDPSLASSSTQPSARDPKDRRGGN